MNVTPESDEPIIPIATISHGDLLFPRKKPSLSTFRPVIRETTNNRAKYPRTTAIIVTGAIIPFFYKVNKKGGGEKYMTAYKKGHHEKVIFVQNNRMVPSRFPSKLLENAVEDFASLPGIGRKTALRLVLHLLRRESHEVEKFGEDLIRLRKEISYCKICHNISDSDICEICSDPKRDKGIICVVENIHNVMAFENTGQYRGVYHVLGGIISPVDGIGPADLEIETLINKAGAGEVSGGYSCSQHYYGRRHNKFLPLP